MHQLSFSMRPCVLDTSPWWASVPLVLCLILAKQADTLPMCEVVLFAVNYLPGAQSVFGVEPALGPNPCYTTGSPPFSLKL